MVQPRHASRAAEHVTFLRLAEDNSMKELELVRQFTLAAVLVAAAAITGCSKKADQSASSAPAPETPAATAPGTPDTASAGNAGGQPAAPPAAPGPGLDSSQMVGNPKAAMAEADAATRQRDYEKAAKILMAIQQSQLDAQQAAVARQQMVSFQRTLVDAIDSGDPNAKAAAAALAGGHRH